MYYIFVYRWFGGAWTRYEPFEGKRSYEPDARAYAASLHSIFDSSKLTPGPEYWYTSIYWGDGSGIWRHILGEMYVAR